METENTNNELLTVNDEYEINSYESEETGSNLGKGILIGVGISVLVAGGLKLSKKIKAKMKKFDDEYEDDDIVDEDSEEFKKAKTVESEQKEEEK